MIRSYNESRILFDRFLKRGTKSLYINIPKASVEAADWNMKIDEFHVYQMNAGMLVLSQQFIPSLERISTVKIDKSLLAYGPHNNVRVTITNIMAMVIHIGSPKAVVAIRTTGKDDRIYIQAI